MSRRTTVLACLVTSTLLTLVAATPAAAAAPRSEWDYVALGDSYSSGVGTSGQTGLCLRSANGYPGLWDKANDPKTFRSVACSGATTSSLRSSQLSALGTGTDLVTLTIGGNDVGFASTVITCTLVSDSACAAKVEEARDILENELPAKLDATYADIKRKAPNAKVVVLGYPILFDEKNAYCGVGGMSIPKRKAINAGNAELNDLLAARSQAAGLIWSDVEDEFAGHGICASSPWLNNLTVVPPQNSFHPNSSGYKNGYLPALSGSLD
ncbi:SGNH/GDSL hydrolase family protein [Actinoplanes friuliensis]|jgi:lysophospholipase L1-like esterase|uniref:Putative GDSL-like lipase/acylhydrolase n=1 Tax=Actinoplanes friuliensis DSM 7358 TaxID=1246995 RepID=U5W6G3_9ACTN|nr:SGNH/GDSL hydrolase family protein [Actinoplanes friuliensis]AGZ44739.1 putative GDSL-like lipase/acylhydrolase [Actinoplanes friuliensis DSM 7358]